MEFGIDSSTPREQRIPCVVAGVYAARRLSPAAKELDTASKGYIDKLVKRGDLEGRVGQTLMLYQVSGTLSERVLLVGCGPEDELSDNKFREIIAKSVASLNDSGVTEAASYLTALPIPERDIYWKLRQSVEAASDALYRFDRLKSQKDQPQPSLKKLCLQVPSGDDMPSGSQALRQGQCIAQGVGLTKDLANLPSNLCTPSYLAAQAKALSKTYPAIKVRVLDDKQMKRLGMGALLAVARGTHEPARFIILEYRGTRRRAAPVVLVGKGVTFDSGGISIKPAASMDEMKYDMSGAASVLGTFAAIASMQLPIRLVGILPSTENMPGGSAVKPGDVVTSLSGQSIEILNTDAEGRLILCDALSYAERYKPAVVIDIATLTGACVVALGHHASGLLSNDEALATELLTAGRMAGDRAWQLPLWEEYQKQLDSPFADMANVGGREAGTITAACFLSRFTKKFKWAHLDIAGTAWRTGNKKGATGRPVPLLVQFLLARSARVQ